MLAPGVLASECTALGLINEANHHVSDEAKDKIVQIRSEKSADTLAPNTWTIVYYDTSVRGRKTEVKFVDGAKSEVGHPFRLFARKETSENVLDRSKLKMDSDQALKIAQKDGLLDKLKLSHSRMTLEKQEETPVWKITFWAGKTHEPESAVEIGDIFVNAENGKIVRRDLHLQRVE